VDLLTLGNGAVGALGFANIAVDAVVGDDQGHGRLLWPRLDGGGGWFRAAIVPQSPSSCTRWTLRCCRGSGFQAFGQRRGDGGMHELADIATQRGNFPDQRRGNEGVL